MKKAEIIVKHPNGYSGVIYGESSMAVFDPKMREVLHTGSRIIDTAEDMFDFLENMPDFVSMFSKIKFDDIEFEGDDDDI